MATKTAQESVEPLRYQTWVLKVPIHCEGCRKTVKKVLQAIDGVYMTTVDSQQHKVTVTGNVDLETLMKKLLRSGKHAEVWPESRKPEELKNMGKPKDSKKHEEVPAEKSEKTAEDDCDDEVENPAGSDEPQRNEGKSLEAGNPDGGGEAGKKKKKKKKNKGQKADPPVTSSENIADALADTKSAPAPQANTNATPALPPPMNPVDAIPPQDYAYPPMYYPDPSPLYGISYREASPSSANASYYVPPMHSYAYSVPPRYPANPPIYPMYHHVDDGYEYDSGCSIM